MNWSVLFLVVWVCLKCGVMHWHEVHPCPDCHGPTRKEVIPDDYWDDKDDNHPSC